MDFEQPVAPKRFVLFDRSSSSLNRGIIRAKPLLWIAILVLAFGTVCIGIAWWRWGNLDFTALGVCALLAGSLAAFALTFYVRWDDEEVVFRALLQKQSVPLAEISHVERRRPDAFQTLEPGTVGFGIYVFGGLAISIPPSTFTQRQLDRLEAVLTAIVERNREALISDM